MGVGGISIWQVLIILFILIIIFGTKKFGAMGSDLGSAVKGFRKAIGTSEKNSAEVTENDTAESDSSNRPS